MEQLGTDFNATGSVMSRAELEEQRKKRGECITCGRKCFQKKLFKMIPITDHGRVENGVCLNCHPLDDSSGAIPAYSRPATEQDVARFNRSQQVLRRQSISTGSVAASSTSSASERPRASRKRHTSSRSLNRTQYDQTGGGSRSTVDSGAPTGSNSRRPQISRPSSSRSMSASSYYSSRSRGSGGDSSSSRDHAEAVARHYDEEDHQEDYRSAQQEEADNYGNYNGDSSGARTGESLDYYQRSYHDQSNRSIRSTDSHESHEGVLDRGGAVLFDPRNGRRLPSSDSIESNGYGSRYHRGAEQHPGDKPRGAAPRKNNTSQRSLESASSFEDDDERYQQNHFPSNDLGSFGENEELRYNRPREQENLSVSQSAGGDSKGSGGDDRDMKMLRDAGDDFVKIMAVMRQFPDSVDVHACGLHTISNLELSEEDSGILVDEGFIQVVNYAMTTYSEDLDLQVFGCRAVWNASGSPENQAAFVEAGCLDVVMKAMARFVDDPELQEQGIAVLANLGAIEDNLGHLLEIGVIPRLVETMNKHASNGQVQVKGCIAFANMASHPSAPKQEMVHLGGGSAIVISMVMHPGDPELQEKALCALRNLSANCDENRVELTNIGVIDAIISAMQVHRNSPGVQQAGAWTLSNLAANSDSNVLIGDCGGIEVIVRAMWVHDQSALVQEWCARALYTLSLDQHNSEIILSVGGIKAIVNAMQNHVDAGPVQEMGCAVLCNLASDQQSKMRIVDEEALDAVVLAMVIHGEDYRVNEQACMLLLKLSIAENFKAMQASNVGELVRTAAMKFPENCGDSAERLIHVIEGYISEYT